VSEDKWVLLAEFPTPDLANVALTSLRSAGINAELNNEYSARNLSHITPMIGGVRVMVLESEFARAKELFSELNAGTVTVEESRDDAADPYVRQVNKSDKLAKHALLVTLFLGYIPFIGPILSIAMVGRLRKSPDSLSKTGWTSLAFTVVLAIGAIVFSVHLLKA
jgi:hypothetical protein